jgi:hypothetical protein
VLNEWGCSDPLTRGLWSMGMRSRDAPCCRNRVVNGRVEERERVVAKERGQVKRTGNLNGDKNREVDVMTMR